MKQNDKPVIEFPCDDYPIKVIGIRSEDFVAQVAAIIERHVPDFGGMQSLKTRLSEKGNYQSINLKITAQSVHQLQALNSELQQCSDVKMVL